MTRVLALGLVVVIFLVGLTVGVLGTHVFYVKRLSDPGGMVTWMSEVAVNRLDRRLDLDDAQRAEIEAIMADTRRESLALRRETEPQLIEILDRNTERIEAVLDPGQRERFERMRERMERRSRRFLVTVEP